MTQINIRIDEELKKQMENICDELGINITTAFTIFAKKLVREQRIPFDVSISSEPRQVIIWTDDPPELPEEEPDSEPYYLKQEEGRRR